MKYKEVQKRFFKHAYFAAPELDPPSDGDGADMTGGGSGKSDGGDSSGEGKKQTLDELLKDPAIKTEFDARINKATNTAIENAKARWKVLTDDQVSEAEKLAKMTAQEKASYLQQKKEKELADREAEITKRELMATAKNTLADKKLPQELAGILVYTDAEACNNSIAAVEKAFNAAVGEAVKDKLKGGEPPKSASAAGSKTDTLEQQVAKAIAGGLY